MRFDKKIVLLSILVLACFISAGGYFYFEHKNFNTHQIHSGEKTDINLVTSKDRKPLPIPPEAVKKGRILTVPILMYHHVADLPKNAKGMNEDLTVKPADFKEEVKWLSDNGYTGINLQDIYLYGLGKFVMPNKPVVFTFDDGYLDVFQNALPILKQYGFTGTFAIITGWPGKIQGKNVYASWADIETAFLNRNEIVSHTQNHFDGSNPKYSPNFILQNLTGSIEDIKQNLGFPANILVYPYGHYTDAYIEQARKLGFVMGVTVHEGKVINMDDLMHIPRIRVHGAETMERFTKMITE